MLEFVKPLMVKGIEKKESKTGKVYSLIIVDGDDGRTLDIYHDGVISLEKDKIHKLKLVYKFSYGKGNLSCNGIA